VQLFSEEGIIFSIYILLKKACQENFGKYPAQQQQQQLLLLLQKIMSKVEHLDQQIGG